VSVSVLPANTPVMLAVFTKPSTSCPLAKPPVIATVALEVGVGGIGNGDGGVDRGGGAVLDNEDAIHVDGGGCWRPR
jgi:hypothetical protein